MPKVSIGLPIFNGANYVDKALDSILGQTFTDFELIISDNGSNDSTQSICRSYEKRDPRVRYFRNEENLGARLNYNRTYDLSKGEYFKWAAHDDLCEPTYLEQCVKALDSDSNLVLSYPLTIIIDEFGNKTSNYNDELDLFQEKPSERFSKCLSREAGECNAVFGLMRSSVLKHTLLIGNFNGSDYILLAQLALYGKFGEIKESLFLRRDHSNTSVRANPEPCQIAKWFDPKRNFKIILPRWRHLWEYFKVVVVSPIKINEKIRALGVLSKWSWWNTRHLIAELRQAIK